ncbi:hypothetical protein CUMW_216290 [Citrus unshiu]|uniref:Uncharacterized protein n=1 Tax=Citrus unshiu TaxID=55188 RepID=A0A2H5QCE5_CITUN|nr:hypothetical protein CUMW_216290 [Citrus unshiu]
MWNAFGCMGPPPPIKNKSVAVDLLRAQSRQYIARGISWLQRTSCNKPKYYGSSYSSIYMLSWILQRRRDLCLLKSILPMVNQYDIMFGGQDTSDKNLADAMARAKVKDCSTVVYANTWRYNYVILGLNDTMENLLAAALEKIEADSQWKKNLG